ncbi:Sensory/regulatory protein RpfC [Hartmannibacter diazotrophicus]|uniref:histidine kinase n=1 Tax=Hartmannibacter diazotrophicus TaxID=1482074 RepID=A0A2C9DD09_9HYPH|nr:response regulator [Hartmannibacter diazotrophicus]SON58222.1 Sensory/regulatory protein RpfC [Hartmannibacter diazotrophicus]
MSVCSRVRSLAFRLDPGIRIAGLLGLASVLIVIGVFALLVTRDRQIAASVREDALWGAYQLDRETVRLAVELRTPRDEFDAKATGLRFDIVYSRLRILKSGKFPRIFGADETFQGLLREVSKGIEEIVPIFDRLIVEKHFQPGERDFLIRHVEALSKATAAIVMHADSSSKALRVDNRQETLSLHWMLAAGVCMLTLAMIGIIVLMARQMTCLRQSRAAIENLNSELKIKADEALAGTRAKSQFLATMSHEIRTPMNGVIGATQLLMDSRLTPEQSDLAWIIRTCGVALLDIINDVLDYSKLEAGRLDIDLSPMDLRASLQHVETIMGPKAADKALGFEMRIDPDVPDRIISDQTRIRQVLLNLVSNAVKFTSKGEVTVTVSRRHDPDGQMRLVFFVADTGMGIEEEARGRLFVEFSQLEASMARRFGGSGLGLAICRRLIELLGGRIGVESVVGSGSLFWFDVPVAEAPAEATAAADALPVAADQISPLSILLAEDNAVNRRVAELTLARLGHRVTFARDGGEAVEAAAQGRFDAILMDMQMPHMDGLEATRRIRALGGEAGCVPIIAMTANASAEDRQACLAAGMDDFTTKPIDQDALVRALMTVRGPAQARAHPVQSCPADGPACETPAALKTASPSDVIARIPIGPADGATEAPASLNPAADLAAREMLEREFGTDILAELTQMFFEDAEELINDLEAAIATGSADALRHAAHTLRGSAANAGLPSVADACDHLRSTGLAAGIEGTTAAMAQLRRTLSLAREKFLPPLRASDAA